MPAQTVGIFSPGKMGRTIGRALAKVAPKAHVSMPKILASLMQKQTKDFSKSLMSSFA
jgi:hypothetical protein